MNVTITPAADKFIRRIMRFSGGPQFGFRMVVSPGGCSGMSAEFGPEAEPKADDGVFEFGGIRFFLPQQSQKLLDGVTIDFNETPTSTGFVFIDPNHSCGCSSKDSAPAFPDLVKIN